MTVSPPASESKITIGDYSKGSDALTPEQQAYGAESKRRSDAQSEAWVKILEAERHLVESRYLLREVNNGITRHRSISLAITDLERAALWLSSIVFVTAPHGPDYAQDNAEAIDLNLHIE